jgi:thioester reductase-like protein
MKARAILITGGDGYIARRVARKLLEDEDQKVFLWVRAADADEFKSKGKQLCQELCESPGRLRLFWGDLRSKVPFSEIDSEEIGTILHTAAVTRFNVDQKTAQIVNVDGASKVFRFADRCPNLNQLLLLSTIYASGLKEGVLTEEPWTGAEGFSNFYEWSKWASEEELLRNHQHLPWKILRIATVISDSESGVVIQQNAFHNTLKLIYYGLLSILPGQPGTPLYFVTGDFVENAIHELLQKEEFARIYHLAHNLKDSLSLDQLIDLVFKIFEEQEDFKKRRILRPLYSDAESFQLLVDAVHQFAGGIVNQAVSSVAPFSCQLYLYKDVRNENMKNALKSYSAPEPYQLIRNTARYLVQTRWGKK